jgi:hypothetical protein
MKNGGIRMLAVAAMTMGCAGASAFQQSGPDNGQYFTLRTSANTQTMRLDGDRLFGPDVEVSRLSDGFRGHVGNLLVDLRTENMKVSGSIGSAHTELYVEERSGGLVVKGLYGGALGSIEMLTEKVSGSIGNCTYDMIRAGTEVDVTARYTGRRACRVPRRAGGVSQSYVGSAEISLPTNLGRRPAVDRAVLMALFLGQ